MDMQKSVLITGANSGMGKAASVSLAKLGFKVFMLCRNREKGRQALEEVKNRAGGSNPELCLCDLGNLQSIRDFAAEFTASHPVLDVLINNAGVLPLKRQTTADGFETAFGINHLGHFLLTDLLLESLKAAEQGRIVVFSSGAHKIGKIKFDDLTFEHGFGPFKAYAQSKLANVLFTKELARRLKGTKVTVNCLHPGAVATNIGVDRKTGFGSGIMGLTKYFFLSPEAGAETAVWLASADEASGFSGLYFYKKKPISSAKIADDPDTAKRLWEISETMTGQNTET